MNLEQMPYPGACLVKYCGDVLEICLSAGPDRSGRAYVRTNLGSGARMRDAAVAAVEAGAGSDGGAWRDIAMSSLGGGRHSCRLPLSEVGVFEAKCSWVSGDGRREWVSGENIRVKVEPAQTACRNTIYNAFVRQFGPARSGSFRDGACRRAEEFLDSREYTAVPPSGRFRDLKRELPFIMERLGFRILQLLPVQPPPVTYARMGRYGSPFAPTDYFSVDTSLAEFDRSATPMDQFQELVDAVHARGGLVLLDLPVDHTGWASTLQVHHPEWFCRNSDGSFASPGAWGVVWEDLCKLDFSHPELWLYLARVFIHWADKGVDGFRCDAGYMVPKPVWRYITQKVRRQHPDTVFFLEGLGGSLETTADLMADGGMDWAYSEIFQVFGADAVREYLGRLFEACRRNGTEVNFAETHDNARLAASGARWSRMRTALAALTAPSGAFGIANGVEWLATEKIDVHGASSLNWGAAENITGHIRRLNDILGRHPAFGRGAVISLAGRGTAVGVRRSVPGQDADVLAIFSVEEQAGAWLEWSDDDFRMTEDTVDLLSGCPVPASRRGDGVWRAELLPGETICLGNRRLEDFGGGLPDALEEQRVRQAVLSAVTALRGFGDLGALDVDGLCGMLRRDVRRFVRMVRGGEKGYAPVVEWLAGRDERRVVAVPPGHFLFIVSERPFRAELRNGGGRLAGGLSFGLSDGRQGMLLGPVSAPEAWSSSAWLDVVSYDGDTGVRTSGRVLLLPPADGLAVPLSVRKAELTSAHLGLAANRRGSYGLARGRWGELHSKYDGLLAAGLSRDCPSERMSALLRCRAWVVDRGASIELSPECEESFTAGYGNRLVWRFRVSTGLGRCMSLEAEYVLDGSANGGAVVFRRLDDGGEAVSLVVRPDVDWRQNHGVTRACDGAETAFPNAVSAIGGGFMFAPYGGPGLRMTAATGKFEICPEWRYRVHFQEDAERSLPCESDVFSPGYFRCGLPAGGCVRLAFGIGGDLPAESAEAGAGLPAVLPFGECLKESLGLYLARRDENLTVVAGYPWFLDWGRDTLICLRGLVAAGRLSESRDIIRAFAGFEDRGTIPNMIRGKDSGDRATSDAPLWLFAAVADLLAATGDGNLLAMDCGGRRLLDILESVAEHYRLGAANGVGCDTESGLVFSPSHYTWMDTNYPAGTPRQGYPVEIQALWMAALSFMARTTGNARYGRWLEQARESFMQLFVRGDGRGLRDCLHGAPGTPARICQGDDAVRPNQLLAVTLGDGVPPALGRSIIDVCQGLMVPGGIRSLDDRPVAVPIPVVRDGALLNDPRHPYWGRYEGDEDTRRKAAYHNGTAWGWQMPLFCEAMDKVYGDDARPAARAWLGTAAVAMTRGCIGHVPEIFDGDAPHRGRGCPAQAWSMAEAYRVWKRLTRS